jgi:hypothetical protein
MFRLLSELINGSAVAGIALLAALLATPIPSNALPVVQPASPAAIANDGEWSPEQLDCANRVAYFQQARGYYSNLLGNRKLMNDKSPAALAAHLRLPAQSDEEQHQFEVIQDLMAIDSSYGQCSY